MPNLPLEVTHSLSFISNTLSDIKRIQNSSSSTIDSLYKMDLKKDGAHGQIRKKSADHREDLDEDVNFIMDDFNLFQKEMSDIIKNKNNETVIYSLRRYRALYRECKEIKKDFTKFTRRTEIKTSKCVKDKDYVRYIAINKTTPPLVQLMDVLDAFIYVLEHLLDEDKKEKKEA